MEKKSELEQTLTLRPGDEKAEVSMGFVAHGSIADFQRIRSFIENETKVRLVRGTMSQSRLWLVKDREFKLLQDTVNTVEKRGGGGITK
jgi:hypothetical protein